MEIYWGSLKSFLIMFFLSSLSFYLLLLLLFFPCLVFLTVSLSNFYDGSKEPMTWIILHCNKWNKLWSQIQGSCPFFLSLAFTSYTECPVGLYTTCFCAQLIYFRWFHRQEELQDKNEVDDTWSIRRSEKMLPCLALPFVSSFLACQHHSLVMDQDSYLLYTSLRSSY